MEMADISLQYVQKLGNSRLWKVVWVVQNYVAALLKFEQYRI